MQGRMHRREHVTTLSKLKKTHQTPKTPHTDFYLCWGWIVWLVKLMWTESNFSVGIKAGEQIIDEMLNGACSQVFYLCARLYRVVKWEDSISASEAKKKKKKKPHLNSPNRQCYVAHAGLNHQYRRLPAVWFSVGSVTPEVCFYH